MNLVHSPALARWFGREVVCRVEGVPDRFALTFDDGPSPTNTPRLLDVLAGHGARATFFVLAGHARRNAALLRRMHEAGHEIGVHGEHHVPPILLPAPLLRRQLDVAAAAVRDACGLRPGCYRAPFGCLTRSQARGLRRLGFVPVLGDVYPEDPHERDAGRIARATLERLRPGSIVILHDSSVFGDASRAVTIAAVELILAEGSRRGLRAATVGEMLASAAAPSAPGADR